MINRNNVVFALLALLALVAAIGFGLIALQLGRDGCMSGNDEGLCPALAEVNGVRYTVSVARGVVATSDDVAAYAPISATNNPSYFTELIAYQLEGISPTALLVAPAAEVVPEDDSPFRVLRGPDSASAFPMACQYFSAAEQSLMDGCNGTTPSGT